MEYSPVDSILQSNFLFFSQIKGRSRKTKDRSQDYTPFQIKSKMSTMIIMWLYCGWIATHFKGAAAYSIQYYNCDKPTNIHLYDGKQVCAPITQADPVATVQTMLLQKRKTQKLTGYKCVATVSTFAYLCGVWGHLKTLKVPKIEHHQAITTQQCKEMVERQQFTTLMGTKVPIKKNSIETFEEIDVGSLKTNADGTLE